MQQFVAQRIIQAIFCLLVVATVVFIIVRLTGNPLDVLTSHRATKEDRELMAKKLGLDKPLIVQYGSYIYRLSHGDFGKSYTYQQSALWIVLERFPATLELVFATFIVSLTIAILLGVYAAIRKGTWLDAATRTFAFAGQSAPIFWTGIMLIFIFSVKLGILPVGGRGELKHIILPAISLGWVISAGTLRLTRSSMLDILGADYIVLARAKGLSKWIIVWKHAFKNATLPIITFSSLSFAYFLGGAVVSETVFSWPGVGRLMMQSVLQRDFPVVQCGVVLLASMYILTNLLVDILYAWLNPKIKYQ